MNCGLTRSRFMVRVRMGCVGAALLGGQRGSAAAQVAPSAGTPGFDSTAAQGAEGDTLRNAGRFAEAMQRYEAVLATSPNDRGAQDGEVRAATALALQYAHEGQPGTALDVLTHASAAVPSSAELYVDLGIEATSLQQYTLAERVLKRALELQPGEPKTIYAMARLEIEEQHLPDAERDLKLYLAARPEDASAYYGLGHAYAMEQRYEEARAAFAQSIKLQPRQTESFYQLGQMDLEAHQDSDAQQMFTTVLARNPKHAGALTGMGELALRTKDYAKAEQLLAQAEQSDPQYATPHYFRGLALAKLGRKDEAAEELRRGDSRPHATSPGSGSDSENQGAAGAKPPGV